MLPGLKMLMSVLQFIYVGQCPWQDSVQFKYLAMGLITCSTMYQTTLASMLILISKGWKYVKSALTKEELSVITLAMAIVYLS